MTATYVWRVSVKQLKLSSAVTSNCLDGGVKIITPNRIRSLLCHPNLSLVSTPIKNGLLFFFFLIWKSQPLEGLCLVENYSWFFPFLGYFSPISYSNLSQIFLYVIAIIIPRPSLHSFCEGFHWKFLFYNSTTVYSHMRYMPNQRDI